MQTNNQSTEGKDPQQTTSESSLDGAACSPSSVRAFRVTETGYFEKPTVTIIRTTTPARAKHRVWESAHSAGYLIQFKSLKVVRAPEYDTAKLKQNWCYSEDFARTILPENSFIERPVALHRDTPPVAKP